MSRSDDIRTITLLMRQIDAARLTLRNGHHWRITSTEQLAVLYRACELALAHLDTPLEQAHTDPDRLENIDGIGPRAASALIEAGMLSYEAVSGATQEQLESALTRAGVRIQHSMRINTWPEQARRLRDE